MTPHTDPAVARAPRPPRTAVRSAVVAFGAFALVECAGGPTIHARDGAVSGITTPPPDHGRDQPSRAGPVERPRAGQAGRQSDDVDTTHAVGRATPGSRRTRPEASPADSVRPGLAAGIARVRDSVQTLARMPLRVPQVALGPGTDDSLYVLVLKAARDRYLIVLSDESDCPGGSVCREGTIAGKRVRPNESLPGGAPVTLAGGRSGVYVTATCGAGCSDAAVVWDEGQYRYRVGLKAGSREQLVQMANSALRSP